MLLPGSGSLGWEEYALFRPAASSFRYLFKMEWGELGEALMVLAKFVRKIKKFDNMKTNLYLFGGN